MPQNIDFGLYIRMRDDYPSILQLAQEAERQGFRLAYANDHFLNLRDEQGEILEAWTLMTAIGVQTGLRISHTVICNSFRNPAMLAKMASTLDVITDGRFELGIGAGWHEREYLAYGYPFPKPLVRVEQLKEAVQIIKKLWTEPETTFRGKHYTLDKCINNPKPVQKPHPPLMIGGSKDKLLRVAAEFADEINLPTSLERIKERIQYVYKQCDSIGRDPKTLRFSWFPRLVLAKDEMELEQLIERYQPKDRTREEFFATALVGTPEIVLERIQEFIELGISRFAIIMQAPTPDRLQLFSNTIMSQF